MSCLHSSNHALPFARKDADVLDRSDASPTLLPRRLSSTSLCCLHRSSRIIPARSFLSTNKHHKESQGYSRNNHVRPTARYAPQQPHDEPLVIDCIPDPHPPLQRRPSLLPRL